MKTVMIAIPKGRPWLNGFVVSLLGVLLYEMSRPSKKYSFSIVVKDSPFEVSEHDPRKYAKIAIAREALVETAIQEKYDYIWFLDDDMVFPMNTFRRLVSHDKDFVTGLAFMKKPPMFPTIFQTRTYRTKDFIQEEYTHILDYPDTLFELEGGAGLFCALIKVDAIKKIRTPRFTSPELSIKSHIGEDISFCRRLWEQGIKMYCEPNIKCGHLLTEKEMITEVDFKHALKNPGLQDFFSRYRKGEYAS